jgi:hypothetical protein
MRKTRFVVLVSFLVGISAIQTQSVRAQNFGGAFQRKKLVLVRKLPPSGHIDGSTFTVKVTGAGIPPDVTQGLQSMVESILISNDARLRSVPESEHPDAMINCQITTYSQPLPTVTQQAGISFGKKPAQPQTISRVTGLMTATFNAQDHRSSKSIAADTVTAKFDQQYVVQNPQQQQKGPMGSFPSILSHLPKSTSQNAVEEEDKPPTPPELRDRMIKNMAYQIASRLVNTTEQVPVFLARGAGLDDADSLMDQKLWTRALEQLETMTPLPQSEDDAYRLYNLGVVNEALGYQSEDVSKARKYLQEASIDYGKAIDAKPSEKYFLQPQTRIDTALAHYKTLGDQAAASVKLASAPSLTPSAPSDALTNADVISMVSAKLDEANILDTIKHASAVKFDLSARGQIDLAKANVNGRIITAMKQKTRGQ